MSNTPPETVGFSTVTSKGQLVIPSTLRRRYGIREGTQVAFVVEANRIYLQPVTQGFVSSLRGMLNDGSGPKNRRDGRERESES
jgi:AbrB family looped-hinge helix DNA binding protein